ncbi:MAG: YfhO family protein [Candidatus Aureabacteria bacterium]|nr:YfhO family protein [Candidatus Auribacterota bacterium]
MRIRKRDLFYALTLMVVIAAFFPPRAFIPGWLLVSPDSDVITQHLPHQLFVRESVMRDRCLPLWNPYECSGTPAFPNPLYMTFAIPHLFLTPLPPPLALSLGFFIHIALAGIAAYVFARRSGCRPAAAMLGAIAYALGTRSLSHVHAGFYPRSIFYAYIPIIFICIQNCARRPSARSAISLSVCIALSLLAGEPQLLIYTIIFGFIYVLVSGFSRAGGMPGCVPKGALPAALAGAALAIPLAAWYLLPSLRLLPLLTRSWPVAPDPYGLMPSLREMGMLLNPWLPAILGGPNNPPWECAIYIGIVPLALALRAACDRSFRNDLAILGIPALLALLLSCAALAPVHALLGRLITPLGLFRNPARILYLFPFFASVLSARALESILAKQRRIPLFWACGFVAGMCLLIPAYRAAARLDEGRLAASISARAAHFFGKAQLHELRAREIRAQAAAQKAALIHSLRIQALLIALICAAGAACEQPGRPRSLLPIILLLISLADLYYFGQGNLRAYPREKIYPPVPYRKALDAAGPREHRLLDTSVPYAAAFWTALPYYASTAMGISRVDGYTPVNLAAYARYLDRCSGTALPYARWSLTVPRFTRPGLLSLLGTGFLITSAPLEHPSLTLINHYRDFPVFRQFLGEGTIPRLYLYKNTEALPRAWLLPGAEPCPDGDALKRLDGLNPRECALLPAAARRLAGGKPFRGIAVSDHGPNSIEMNFETRAPSCLCTSEVWAPGWTATDNGVPVEVLRINGIYRGVMLDAGRHGIRMAYRPPGLRLGALLSLGTLLFMAASLLAGKRTHTP